MPPNFQGMCEKMICDVWFETLNSSRAGSSVLLAGGCLLALYPHGCVLCVCLRRSAPFKENRVGRCSSPASCSSRHWASANSSWRWEPCWQIACPNPHASTAIWPPSPLPPLHPTAATTCLPFHLIAIWSAGRDSKKSALMSLP